MGKSPIEFMHPDDINRCIKIIQKTFKTGEGFGEFRLRRKNGSYVWLEVNAKIIIDKKGETKAILISRDINKRKLMEDKLKKSEERYRLITENANDIILVINQKLECEYINEQVSIKIWGYNKDDLINKSVLKLIHPDDLKIAANSLRKGFKSGEGEAIFRIKKKDGCFAWFEIRGKGFNNEHGIRKALLISRDITERKLVEEKYRQIFENSPLGIILIDQQGIIINCNPAFEKFIGYEKGELISKKYSDLSIIHPKYLPILLKRLKEIVKEGILPPIDVKIHRKDGTLMWAHIQSSLIKVGDEIFIQVIGNDITSRKKAELLKMEEIKKLKELDKIRKNLIASISHELKTPLMSISGTTELLTNFFHKQIGNDALELIKILEKGGKRLSYLVDNLLDISKLEFKKLKLNFKKENLSDVILECSKEMKFFMKERDIELSLNLPEEIFLEIDKLRMEQVILNILSNAIKNTPPKGKIFVSLQLQNNDAILIISDTGVGLTKEEISKLFTRFGKLERHEEGLEYANIQGAGLGLFISKELIELHGGKISANSKGRNKGSCFIIKLPT